MKDQNGLKLAVHLNWVCRIYRERSRADAWNRILRVANNDPYGVGYNNAELF